MKITSHDPLMSMRIDIGNNHLRKRNSTGSTSKVFWII